MAGPFRNSSNGRPIWHYSKECKGLENDIFEMNISCAVATIHQSAADFYAQHGVLDKKTWA
jgi:hypothetical protein